MKQRMTYKKHFIPYATSIFVAVCSALFVSDVHSASVAGRTAPARAKVSSSAARVPVTKSTTTATVTTTEEASQPVVSETVVEEETFEFENRTSMFDEAIGASGTNASGATSDSELAEMIRKQRNALNAAEATATTQQSMRTAAISGKNACDTGLRQCMQSKCGADFTKCSGDTDTTWGDKMDLCRLKLECTGHEYQLFSTEIKADRDINAQLANYNKIIDCGNRYNNCIMNECGNKLSKCLGKSAGDAAISKCKKIQNECTQMDNGLASRMMNVFATLRQDAEKQIQRDEQRLYDMRDEMERTCRRLGAMFDQRSLDCVYTINFFADNSTTPYASKKSYAGGTFDCDPGWFGIDVTTFKENAYRETIAQKSASAAMLGSGVGMAAGAITSGAIDRALDTQKAKKALDEAEQGDQPDKKAERAAKKDERQAEKDAKKEERQEKRDAKKAEQEAESQPTKAMCDAVGGEWRASTKRCRCTNAAGKTITTKDIDECVVDIPEDENVEDEDDFNTTQIVCEDLGGTWSDNQCSCKDANGRSITTKDPINDCVKLSEVSESSDNTNNNESSTSEQSNDQSSKAKCKSKVYSHYIFSIKDEPRYKEILNELDNAEEAKLNAYLDTPETGSGSGRCNGALYSYTAGQTPREFLPEACWSLRRKTGLFLEKAAQEQFIDEKVEQECN